MFQSGVKYLWAVLEYAGVDKQTCHPVMGFAHVGLLRTYLLL